MTEDRSFKDIISDTKMAKNVPLDQNSEVVFKTRISKYSTNPKIDLNTRVELSTRTVCEDNVVVPSDINQNESKED